MQPLPRRRTPRTEDLLPPALLDINQLGSSVRKAASSSPASLSHSTSSEPSMVQPVDPQRSPETEIKHCFPQHRWKLHYQR